MPQDSSKMLQDGLKIAYQIRMCLLKKHQKHKKPSFLLHKQFLKTSTAQD